MKGIRGFGYAVTALTFGVVLAQISVLADDIEDSGFRGATGRAEFRTNEGYSIEQVVADALSDCNCPAPLSPSDCAPPSAAHPAPPTTPDDSESLAPRMPDRFDTPPSTPRTPLMAQTPNIPQPGYRGSMNRIPGFIGDFFGTGLSTITIGANSIPGRFPVNFNQSYTPAALNEIGGRARLFVYNNGTNLPLDSVESFGAVNSRFISEASNSFQYAIREDGTTTAIGNAAQQSLNQLAPGSVVYDSSGNQVVIGANGANAGTYVYVQGTASFDPAQSQPINGGRPLQTVQNPGMGGAVDDFSSALTYGTTVESLNSEPIVLEVPSPAAGGASVGRLKLAENTSPIPRDRVYLNYSYFDNVRLSADGVDVNRFSPGFEKTFFDGQASFEFRVPIAATLDSNSLFDSGSGAATPLNLTNTSNAELGNLTMWLKAIIYRTETWAASTGLGITVPTADDVNVRLFDGFATHDLININNRSVHLMPFVGIVCAPNDRVFYQGMLQFDFDANGNPVGLNQFDVNTLSFTGLSDAGRINDTTFLFLDVGAGYWFHQSDEPYETGLTGLAGIVELHYNAALQTTDVVSNGNFQVGDYLDNIQVLNAVVGSTFEFDYDKTATFAYVIPLEQGQDRQFDGEFRLFFNWFFGRRDRLTRPVF